MDPIIAGYRASFASHKDLAEQAVRQLDDAQLFIRPQASSNSVACLLKHVGGHLHSRWTDLFGSDLEKPDRDRASEFAPVIERPQEVIETWERGWSSLRTALDTLRDDDLVRMVTLRGRPLRLADAMPRTLGHTAFHAGQIVFIAKLIVGPAWRPLV